MLPFANFTEFKETTDMVMPLVEESLKARGFVVVAGQPVEDILYRYRVRQTSMVDSRTARALAEELGVGGVMVGMISLAQLGDLPQLGVSARMLALPDATILWAQDVSISGDDFTGPLGVGTVHSMETLSGRAVGRLLATLQPRLEPQVVPLPKPPGFLSGLARPEPPVAYRNPSADFYGVDSLAVLPFLNVSGRPNAGDIVTMLFVSALHNTGRIRVVEPGLVRENFLRFRVRSLGAVDILDLAPLNRHFRVHGYLLGTVYEYNEGGAQQVMPLVHITISARMVRFTDAQVVWSMEHRHRGDDFNLLLDFDRIYSIIPLAQLTVTEMVLTFTSF